MAGKRVISPVLNGNSFEKSASSKNYHGIHLKCYEKVNKKMKGSYQNDNQNNLKSDKNKKYLVAFFKNVLIGWQ